MMMTTTTYDDKNQVSDGGVGRLEVSLLSKERVNSPTWVECRICFHFDMSLHTDPT